MTGRYELVAVARTPQAATTPTLSELGPISAPAISWLDELNGPGSIGFSVEAARLQDDIRDRLANLDEDPVEVWLYRDGVIIAAAFVAAYTLQGGTLTATCPGLLGYLGYMHVVTDLAYAATDVLTIAAGLVDQWQALSYGDYGIDTSSVGTAGVTVDKTYLAVEQHNVLRRLLDLGQGDDGFDAHVDPDTRELVLDHPTRGTDLSASVVIDARNITDDTLTVSVAPGDLASDVLAVGTGVDQSPLTKTVADSTVRSQWGRAGATAAFDGILAQADLDQRADAFAATRAAKLVVPGSKIVPVADVTVGTFAPGDTVTYSFDGGLGTVTLARRVTQVRVDVDEHGEESISAAFA